MHLAWPLTLREQGPLLREGIDAVTITARAELPRGEGPDTLAGISENRLTRFGRAAFASVLAFDSPGYQGKPPSRYLTAGRNVIPGWSLALFALGPDPARRHHRLSTPSRGRAAAARRSVHGCDGRWRPRCRSR